MTNVVEFAEASAVSSPTFEIPEEADAVYALPSLPDAYYVQPAAGKRGVVIISADLKSASSSPEAIVPTWSNADRVILAYGLGPLVERATEIMRELFGDESRIVPEIMSATDSVTPMLVLRLHVPRSLRHVREAYLDRYSRETEVPADAPAPALLWTYQNASVSA